MREEHMLLDLLLPGGVKCGDWTNPTRAHANCLIFRWSYRNEKCTTLDYLLLPGGVKCGDWK